MSNAETTARSRPVDDERDEDASEAQAQVIASLRVQVTDLFSQVTQLNSKLVASYDRVSDLEDQLHDSSSSLRNASVTISALELERSHHLAALNTGLLVEKAHVTAELNRLMERATEEAAQRGQAETARQDIEKDLDDLSATLFDQANTMVAEARLNQAKSERKVQDAEQALKIAEDAVKDMQVQMQSLQAEKEAAEREAREANVTMGKGKWVERDDPRIGEAPRIRFMTTHTPYAEFVAFVTHLRGLRVSQPTPPAISTILNQPFIARLLNEDSEPTVRLDLAPFLNWLSRRSVLAAIHTGMLTVEPVAFSNLVQELQQHPQSTFSSSLSCALCGTLIARLPSTPVSRTLTPNGGSWFKYPLALSSTHNHNAGTPPPTDSEPPGQVYVFRLAAATTSAPPPSASPTHGSSVSMPAVGTSSRPLNAISSSRVIQAQTHSSLYPLCTSNYCLMRLRNTCSLWAFVRVGIVERIWEEEVAHPSKTLVNGDTQEAPYPPASAGAGSQPPSNSTTPSTSEKPPIPPRRRRLWEMASAFGERATGWAKESGESVKEKEKESTKIPPPPPSHPSAPHPHAEPYASRVDLQGPPPLPKRNVIRDRATTDTIAPPSTPQNGVVAPKSAESTSNVNGHINPDEVAPNASDSPSTPVDEITFATPPFETSVLPPTTSEPVSAELSVPPNRDPSPPPSPDTVPPLATSTAAAPMACVASPTPRPRPRVSSPASPHAPSSRSASPALNRSRTESPVPAGIVRTTSPSPGRTPTASQIRGKTSMLPSRLVSVSSSGPASPAPASGPAAPPLPRRAPARRAVPPPPTLGAEPMLAEEGAKEVVVAPVETTTPADPIPEAEAHEASEGEVVPETKSGDTQRNEGVNPDVVQKATVAQAPFNPTPTTEADPVPGEDIGVAGDVEGTVNGMYTIATAVSDPRPLSASGGDGCTSVDTASTKQSSSTEGEGFASDATWEERAWKELVRLKEDMFWARIGGIRAVQGDGSDRPCWSL